MKYALVIPDGVADEPQPSLDGKTPLQAARLPNMDEVASVGIVGQTNNVPASMPSGSDVGTMSLFGYDPLTDHTGRAPIEAAARNIELRPGDWAIRCNLVTIQKGRMVSFTAGQYPSEAGAGLIKLLQKDLCGSPQWKFHTGVSYRNLLVYRARDGMAPFSSATATTPPHDITDQPVVDYLPKGPGSESLLDLMCQSESLFATAPENKARRVKGELPATGIWLWGEGCAPTLEPFQQRFGKRGSVITAVDLLRGLAKLIGWNVIEVEGATGYLDTDYAAKGQAAIDALETGDTDFIVVHVEAPDEASHEGRADAKVEAVQNIDQHIVRPLHDYLRSLGDYRLLISPDHPTFLRTKTHSHGFCPFAMCGTGIEADSASTYDEVEAAESSLTLDHGHELMPFFVGAS